MFRTLLIRASVVALFTGLYLGLVILGGGGIQAFFSNSARTALVVVMLALVIASLFVGGNLSCVTCHDPQATDRALVLRLEEGELCLACHRN